MKLNMRRSILLVCSLLIVIILWDIFERNESLSNGMEYTDNDAIIFSKKTGYYSDSIYVELRKNINIPLGAKIYYSLDGSNPDSNSSLYKKKIYLPCSKDSINVFPLKAVLYFKDEISAIYEETFFVGGKETFYGLDIVSVEIDPHDLYDYYEGIFVEGYEHEKNKQNYNFSMRGDTWIKKSRMVMVNSDGDLLIDSSGGIKVSGNGSRGLEVKSLIFEANHEDFGDGKVYLDFYQGNEYQKLNMVENFGKLKLRSGSYDRNFTNIKSSVVSKLAEEIGLDAYLSSRRSIVYLNGSFYGIFDIQNTFNKGWIADRFGLSDSSSVQILKLGDPAVYEVAGFRDLFLKDLNDPQNRIELEKCIDMDDYLKYYAFEIIINNNDWPHSNVGIWKYEGELDSENEYTDGRYRMLPYDFDLAFFNSEKREKIFGADNLSDILNGDFYSVDSTFVHVMNSNVYRNKFIMYMESFMNGSMSSQKMCETVYNEWARISKATEKLYGQDIYLAMNDYVEHMVDDIKGREKVLEEDFKEFFGLEKRNSIVIETGEGCNVFMPGKMILQKKEYKFEHYSDVPFTVVAEEYPGYVFEKWVVNGTPYYDKELVINNGGENEEIRITAIAKRQKELNGLIIERISAKSDSDWICVCNVSDELVNVSEYYLSDSEKKLKKYHMPLLLLKPGESIKINGKGNYYAINEYICNFNLNNGEKLILSDMGGNVIDSVNVKNMGKHESYGRLNKSNVWVYYRNIED